MQFFLQPKMSVENQPKTPSLCPRSDPDVMCVFNNSGSFEPSTSQSQREASSTMSPTYSFPGTDIADVSAEVLSRKFGSSQGGAGDRAHAPVKSRHQKALTCRRKHRTPYAWLHRDLTLEDEYNIATVDGEDLDNSNCSRSQPTARAATYKPVFTPHSRSSEEQSRSLQRVRKACRADREIHYTEYHLHEWYTNFSDVKRRIKHISYVALFEPCAVTVTDVYHTTVTEDIGRSPGTKARSLKRSLSLEASHYTDEHHLPLKKRKRYMAASTTNTAATGSSRVDTATSPAARCDPPSASQAAPVIHMASAPATTAEHHPSTASTSPSSSLSNPGSRRHAIKRHATWDDCLPLKKNKTS
ncbi:uncharacterized protein LOC124258337 [Haliotis rubra]|uniref:uncharacterized protein LOC124258337 n=1 Tax=Haliotis rubra TaxID=36100 RepID=UPI001EE50E8F|nr:uncharacterized protein LOC124258337 [Haliotis rubra]